jgi:hypothetical protein
VNSAAFAAAVSNGPVSRAYAIGGRARHSGEDPLADHGPFELGEDTHHLEHRLARGRRCVESLLMQLEINAAPRRVSLSARTSSGAWMAIPRADVV